MDNSFPATQVDANYLWAVLDEAGVLRPPIRQDGVVAIETDLSVELAHFGEQKNAQIELHRDFTVTNRKKYHVVTTALRNERGLPVWAHRLWNARSIPPHTGFGTLLEGPDGYYRAGIEVGVCLMTSEVGPGLHYRLQAIREGVAAGDLPALPRLLKLLESVSEAVIDIGNEVRSIKSVVSVLQQDIGELRAASDLGAKAESLTVLQKEQLPELSQALV
ncbi:hypothetical protein R1sor_001276 [Riccia sorocarpa]|uniref:Uncharacterized protein n=1 Tax=Riccia sorocarpa TaxID=122646 RepID=A0ABD3H1H5_9MARC